MSWSQLAFVGRRVRHSLWGLLWNHVLTSGTMAMSLFVFGSFVLLQDNLQELLKGWGEQIQINAYLEKDIGHSQVSSIRERIRTLPAVEHVRYVSQEQAWQDLQAALGTQSGVLEGLPPDVLPASFEISVKPAYRDGSLVAEVAKQVGAIEGLAAVEYPQEWVERLSLIVLAVQWTKWVLGGILFLATFFIVSSTVRLAVLSRKDEIEIMQLVGASEGLIRAPFVVEGMLQGAVGSVAALFCLWLLYLFLHQHLLTTFPLFGSVMQIRFLEVHSILLILVLGWLLGALGSLSSLGRFLRTWRG